MTDETRTPPGRRAIGVLLWWLVTLVVAPPTASIASGILLTIDTQCYPGPTRLGCLDGGQLVVGLALPGIVLALLWGGAHLLARGGCGPTPGVRMLRAHAAVVAVLTAAYLAATVATRVDDYGSVGSALLLAVGGMPLLDLGLPWSLVHMPSLRLPGVWGDVADPATTVVPAVLNVALHADLRRLRRRRLSRAPLTV